TVRHEARRAAWDAEARAASGTRPIAVEWLGTCVGQLLREAPDCVVVDESVTSTLTLWRYLDRCEPGTIFGSGGSALGWGLGAAVGVKLAYPDRPVVVLVGDGSFVFGAPLTALWVAQTSQAPILTVVCNNSGYRATKDPLVGVYPNGS